MDVTTESVLVARASGSRAHPSGPEPRVPSSDLKQISIGIATRNRRGSLLPCLTSLSLVADMINEVLVVDDTSDEPLGDLGAETPPVIAAKLQLIVQPGRQGPIVARNTTVRFARNECVLLMDDDAYVIDPAAIRRGLDVFRRHGDIGAVAFAQAEADGAEWPAAMPPATATSACYVPAYIGFAQLLRAAYSSSSGIPGAAALLRRRKRFLPRLLNAGYSVVYVPDARVAHVPDRSGRSASRYLRYVIRNDCLSALYNEPLPLPVATVPLRLMRYASMRRHGGVNDPGGLTWILRELVDALPSPWHNRRPVAWRTFARWRKLPIDERRTRAARGVRPRVLFVGGDFARKGGPDLIAAWREGNFARIADLDIVTDHTTAPVELPGVRVLRGIGSYSGEWAEAWRHADLFVMPTHPARFRWYFRRRRRQVSPASGRSSMPCRK